jgi:hypothetical protein
MVDVKNAIPTKDEAKDTTLETVAIGAIPIGIGLIQAGQLEAGVLTAAIGIICLVLKYKLRA